VTVIREDYEVLNAQRTVFFTSPDRDLAVAFVKSKSKQFPGLFVEAVTVTEVRRPAYRPRPRLVA
jgi:hypothetical protein